MSSETEIANEILSYIQNLDDAEEAREFVRLWLKAIEHVEPDLDEDAVLRNIRDVDSRIKGDSKQ